MPVDFSMAGPSAAIIALLVDPIAAVATLYSAGHLNGAGAGAGAGAGVGAGAGAGAGVGAGLGAGAGCVHEARNTTDMITMTV
jgi:hypothetical protein